MDAAFFSEKGKKDLSKALGLSAFASKGWASIRPHFSTPDLVPTFCNYLTELSGSFQELSIHLSPDSYESFLLNLRVLLVKEFNRKIHGLEQSDVANIKMYELQQVLDGVDFQRFHFFFLSLKPEHRLVFDMGTNLTDLSHFNVPSTIRGYVSKLSKYKGKQASVFVLMIIKRIEMTLGERLSDEHLKMVWDKCHELAILKVKPDECKKLLGAKGFLEGDFNSFFDSKVANKGIMNVSGLIQLLEKCQIKTFCNQFIEEKLSLAMLLKTEDRDVFSKDWMVLKIATYYLNTKVSKATDNPLLLELAKMEGLSLDEMLKVLSLARYPVELVINNGKK